MTEPSEPLYVVSDDRAFRVLGTVKDDGRVPCAGPHWFTVWPRMDREFTGYTGSDYRLSKRPFGADYTLVTLSELAYLRLVGRITEVVETGE